MRTIPAAILICGLAGGLAAQQGDHLEISAVGGGSLYRDLTARGADPARTAKVGFYNGAAAGVVACQRGGEHWDGELHYLFQTNHMRLRAGEGAAGSASFAARSHTFHFDGVLYATRRDARIRPFIAGGPGLKVYQATGQERAFQPLNNIVVFSKENQTKFLVSAGGGIKFKIHKSALVRLDFRDYMTGIPKNFTAFPGVKLSGQFHNLVATVGVGVVF